MENKTKQSIIILLSLALIACNTANVPTDNNVGINHLQSNQTKSRLYVLEVSKNKGASFTFNINIPRNGFALKANTSGAAQKTAIDIDHYKIYLLKNASTTEYPNTGDPISDAVFGPFIVSAVAETITTVTFDKVPPSTSGAYYMAVLAEDSSNNNLIEVNNDNGSINWSGTSAGVPYNGRIAVSSGAGVIVDSNLSVSDTNNLTVTPNFQNGVGVHLETNITVNNGSVTLPGITGEKVIIPVGRVSGQFQVNSYTMNAQRNPSVATDITGNYVVVWESSGSYDSDNDGYSIHGQRYDRFGGQIGAEFQINTYTTGYQINPKVAMNRDGDFVVVWQSYGSFGTDTNNYSIQGQRYNSSGSPVGIEFQINTYTNGQQSGPSVSMDSTGDFVVAWESYYNSGGDNYYSIQGQRYFSTGSKNGTEFQVNTYTTGEQSQPSVSMDTAGDFVIVWKSYGSNNSDTDSSSIQAQRYDSAGSAIGPEFQINTYTTGEQSDPSVAMDADGDFVVAWQSYYGSNTDNYYSIQGQRYNSAGSATGAEFQVNTYTTDGQYNPSIAMDSDGDFVITWESHGSNDSDTDGYSIQGQKYNISGLPVDAEFQVNIYTTNYQGGSTVAMDVDGDFVVIWHSQGTFYNDYSGYSIQGQRYEKILSGGCGGC